MEEKESEEEDNEGGADLLSHNPNF